MKQKTVHAPSNKLSIMTLSALFLCLLFIFLAPHSVGAVTRTAEMRQLTKGRTYTCYDVTGDLKKDSFCYRSGETGYTNFYINGKYVSRVFTARGSIVYWARLTNAKVYLLVSSSLYGGQGHCFMQYKNGKFVTVSGSLASEKYNFRFFQPSRVAGHSVFFTGSPKFMPDEFNNSSEQYITGTSKFTMIGGKFQLQTRYLTPGGTTSYTTSKGFYTSTSNTTKNTAGIYVPRGARVKVVKIFMPTTLNGYPVRYLISYGGKTGWLFSQNA